MKLTPEITADINIRADIMHAEIMQLIKLSRRDGKSETSSLAFLSAEMYVELTEEARTALFVKVSKR
jgi:hypothetical protein